MSTVTKISTRSLKSSPRGTLSPQIPKIVNDRWLIESKWNYRSRYYSSLKPDDNSRRWINAQPHMQQQLNTEYTKFINYRIKNTVKSAKYIGQNIGQYIGQLIDPITGIKQRVDFVNMVIRSAHDSQSIIHVPDTDNSEEVESAVLTQLSDAVSRRLEVFQTSSSSSIRRFPTVLESLILQYSSDLMTLAMCMDWRKNRIRASQLYKEVVTIPITSETMSTSATIVAMRREKAQAAYRLANMAFYGLGCTKPTATSLGHRAHLIMFNQKIQAAIL